MSRARDIGHFALGAAIVAAWVLWWAPSVSLWLARMAGLRTWHFAELAAVDVLFAFHRDRAARRVLAASIRRNRRQLRAARDRVQ